MISYFDVFVSVVVMYVLLRVYFRLRWAWGELKNPPFRLPYVSPKRAARAYLDTCGAKYGLKRKGWVFKESDDDFKKRIEIARESQSLPPTKVTIEPKYVVLSTKTQNGYEAHLKETFMAQHNPPYYEGRFGEWIPNPDYDPNLTFEQVRAAARAKENKSV
jgi:hypothetical protein